MTSSPRFNLRYLCDADSISDLNAMFLELIRCEGLDLNGWRTRMIHVKECRVELGVVEGTFLQRGPR